MVGLRSKAKKRKLSGCTLAAVVGLYIDDIQRVITGRQKPFGITEGLVWNSIQRTCPKKH